MDVTQLDEFIWQGGYYLGDDHKVPPNIKAVLDLRLIHEPAVADSHLLAVNRMPIDDAMFPGVKWLDMAVWHLSEYYVADWPTLVMCAAGVSRSSMVTTAFFMWYMDWTRDKALAFVKSKRECANPNPWFMEGLLEYEKYLGHYRDEQSGIDDDSCDCALPHHATESEDQAPEEEAKEL